MIKKFFAILSILVIMQSSSTFAMEKILNDGFSKNTYLLEKLNMANKYPMVVIDSNELMYKKLNKAACLFVNQNPEVRIKAIKLVLSCIIYAKFKCFVSDNNLEAFRISCFDLSIRETMSNCYRELASKITNINDVTFGFDPAGNPVGKFGHNIYHFGYHGVKSKNFNVVGYRFTIKIRDKFEIVHIVYWVDKHEILDVKFEEISNIWGNPNIYI